MWYGDILLLDDGRVQLKVLEVQGMKVFTEVTVGGPLSNNKGINKLGGGLCGSPDRQRQSGYRNGGPDRCRLPGSLPSHAVAKI